MRGHSCQLRRFTLRLDRFVSAQARLNGGQLLTKPFFYKGSKLAINYSTSAAGSVRVEMRNVDGNPIQGFTFDESKETYGDHVERIVSWESGSNVSSISGMPVRLCFSLRDADLFAFQFLQ